MGYDLYAFRASRIKDIDAARGTLEREVEPPADLLFQDAVADALIALGFRGHATDYEEVAKSLEVSVDEARRLVTSTSLSHESEPVEIYVSADGVTFDTGWLRDPDEQERLVSLLWSCLEVAEGIEPILVYEPQADSILKMADGREGLRESFVRQTEAVLQLLTSPDFSSQVREAIEASIQPDAPGA